MPVRSAFLARAAAALACALSLISSANAGLVNDVPSCWAATHLAPSGAPYDRLVYVLLDQTVQLDPMLDQSVVDNTMRLLQPGTKFVIAEFSAFSQGHYLNVLHTGILEKPLPASRVSNTPIQAAKHLEQCLGMQRGFAQRMAIATLADVLKSSTASLDQSDIMQALKTVSTAVRDDPAKQKLVFVVTDGLENSSVTSFYAHNAARNIDPKVELAKAAAAHEFGNFGGATVYVLGGATMPPAQHGTQAQMNGYRDPPTLLHLKQFWQGYFARSNATLAEFGEPALVTPVAFP
ncbi:MAG: hypothetical protein AB1434_14605 [Pseudomonadota bacterium]